MQWSRRRIICRTAWVVFAHDVNQIRDLVKKKKIIDVLLRLSVEKNSQNERNHIASRYAIKAPHLVKHNEWLYNQIFAIDLRHPTPSDLVTKMTIVIERRTGSSKEKIGIGTSNCSTAKFSAPCSLVCVVETLKVFVIHPNKKPVDLTQKADQFEMQVSEE